MQLSTLIPDEDNAAVGNALALLQEDTTKGILLFFFILEKGGNEIHLCGGLRGERPESCISAMGIRVPA